MRSYPALAMASLLPNFLNNRQRSGHVFGELIPIFVG
jgi:hypothetical protein